MMIGVGLVGVLGWAGYRTFSELNVAGRQGGAIRMVNPEFHGRSKTEQPYVVTAQSAVRDTRHPEQMLLDEPRLVMQTLTRGEVHGAARSGLYDENTHYLNLWGGVTMADALGYHFASPTTFRRIVTASAMSMTPSGAGSPFCMGATSPLSKSAAVAISSPTAIRRALRASPMPTLPSPSISPVG